MGNKINSTFQKSVIVFMLSIISLLCQRLLTLKKPVGCCVIVYKCLICETVLVIFPSRYRISRKQV